jgi:single-stranded-DNA-specific exonuclease
LMEKRWIIQEAPAATVSTLARALELHPLVARSLALRGFTEPEPSRVFLEAKLATLPHVEKLCGAEQAASKIADAMEQGTTICIYGDYDVDGVSSTALLIEFFRLVNYPVRYRIPSRMSEGYGFHEEAVNELAAEGVGMIITVDCGISGHEACLAAKKVGVSVIVTDHHEILDDLPHADAVVNPKQPGCGFAEEPLAGVGIAFFLAAAIRRELLRREKIDPKAVDIRSLLDLVTLGTVADVAPIIGVNRSLVSYGLTQISNGDRPGIEALKRVSKIEGRDVLCGHISFQLAPRINAAGRLGDASLGVQLLSGLDAGEVNRIAVELDKENTRRQGVEAEILEDARRQFFANENRDQLFTIVLAGKEWHPGVVGIVASRFQDEFYRPAILISFEGGTGIGRGSARSVSGFNIFKAIAACSEHLEGFGGHKYAAGIQIREEKLVPFAIAFERYARGVMTPEMRIPTLSIDSECELDQIDEFLVAGLSRLAPFGVGNSEPVYLVRDAEVTFKKVVGKTHLKLRLRRKNDSLTTMAFGSGDLIDHIDNRIDIAFTVHINEYRGKKELQLIAKDIRPV